MMTPKLAEIKRKRITTGAGGDEDDAKSEGKETKPEEKEDVKADNVGKKDDDTEGGRCEE